MPDTVMLTPEQIRSETAAAVGTLKELLEANAKKNLDEYGDLRHKAEEMNNKLTDLIEMKRRLEVLETRASYAGTERKIGVTANDAAMDAHRQALGWWLRTGTIEVKSVPDWDEEIPVRGAGKSELILRSLPRIPAMEKKVLAANIDPTAGYLLAPPEFVDGIEKPITLFSPIRQFARVRQTSRPSVKLRVRSGVFDPTGVAEQGTRSETTGLAYEMKECLVHELYARVDVSWEELEDSAVNIEADLQEEAGLQFARIEGDWFINGNGVGKPWGIIPVLTAASAYTALGHASTIQSLDGLITLQHAIKTGYAGQACWCMRRETIGVLRIAKAGDGHYLWEPAAQVAAPGQFLGSPVCECPDVPAVAANAYAVIYGDCKRGFTIVDRINMQVIRDPYSSKNSGAVEFLFRRRLGGMVVIAEALRLGKIATS